MTDPKPFNPLAKKNLGISVADYHKMIERGAVPEKVELSSTRRGAPQEICA